MKFLLNLGLTLLLAASAAAATPGRRHIALFPVPPGPKTVVMAPSKDATLYQTPDGSLANGQGLHIFAGSTAGRLARRTLLAFDIAAKIPAGSTITRVVLTLHVSQTISGTATVRLHSVSRDWGEGPSNAGGGRDGIGRPAEPGDATWVHNIFPGSLWSTPGGDFAAVTDASAAVGTFGTDSVWDSSPAMVARVQDWLDHPTANFGWILIGDETTAVTTKRFDSREGTGIFASPPTLTVEYTSK
jgi:hypothetical protein